MVTGYMGKILWVDLTGKKLKEEALDAKLCRQFIGGYGIGARILFNRMKAGADPLGPENILGFISGPFTGTQAIGGSRYIVVCKSPLTGTWGDANSGGDFGPCLKFAGYDGVFFTGQAEKPLYLFIDNGVAELRDASHLRGKDSFETEDLLKAEHGKETEVACIGPSGERPSLIAAIMNNKGRAAARSGVGAVMGSKKLKAIAVRGSLKISLFDEALAAELRKKYLSQLAGPVFLFRDFGTPGATIHNVENGDSPVKNWDGVGIVDFKEASLLGVEPLKEKIARRYGCWRCPVACGGIMKEGTGEYKYAAGSHRPEYETISMFGPNCLNTDMESIILVNDICNRYGLDAISVGSTIAFCIECYERGLITKQDTGGIEMTWGNHRSIVAMTEKLARAEGFGAVLADGAKAASEKIGKGSEKYAIHMQGQEYPAHDPKFSKEIATFYRMDPTPGRHMRSGTHIPPGLPLPQIDPASYHGRGEFHKISTNFNHIIDTVGMCAFLSISYPHVDAFVEFLNAITGWNTSVDELIKTGERIANIRHAFNIREGLNPLTFKNPDRVVGIPAKTAGPLAGVTIDEETLDREYLDAMDWDLKTTKPSKQKLIELDLEDVARVLYSDIE